MPKILIVEDEADIQRAYSIKFTKEGFDVIAAGDGMTALAMLEQGERPDIILLDVVMPKMDGLTVLKKLNEKRYGIPVILLTNLDNTFTMLGISALPSGAAGYFVKSDTDIKDIVEAARKTIIAKKGK